MRPTPADPDARPWHPDKRVAAAYAGRTSGRHRRVGGHPVAQLRRAAGGGRRVESINRRAGPGR